MKYGGGVSQIGKGDAQISDVRGSSRATNEETHPVSPEYSFCFALISSLFFDAHSQYLGHHGNAHRVALSFFRQSDFVSSKRGPR